MKVSILIPCFNEKDNINLIIDKVLASPIEGEKEIIIVDDASTDGSQEILKTQIASKVHKILFHDKNKGKGGAIQTGIKECTGDILIIQDADLEYDPNEYQKLINPILDGHADVVYGSRFLTREVRRVHYYWSTLANYIITLFFNIISNTNFTDIETCYKVFSKKIYSNLILRENRFAFDPEITSKVIKMKARCYEVSISYYGRSFEEGKKIGWKDGISALRAIIKYSLLGMK